MAKAKRSKSGKSGKPTPRPRRSQPNPWTGRTVPTDERAPLYRKLFYGVAGITLLALLLGALHTGMNSDDLYQNRYSEALVDYYTTFGSDTTALYMEDGNMHYYGGLFDLTTGLVNRALGYDAGNQAYHDVRHVFNAAFGFVLMLFIGLFGKLLGGWRTGLIALLFAVLSPRLFGHSLMNPKDIPFAAGNLIALYHMARYFMRLPEVQKRDVLGIVIGIGIAISMRAGGLLLLGYLGLFSAVSLVVQQRGRGLFANVDLLKKYVIWGLVAGVGGYILAVLFWPFALVNPLAHPLEALTEFSKLGIKIRVLFEGENTMSDQTPWYYVLSWIYRTIPLFALLGFAASFAFLPRWLKQLPITPVLLLFFAALFPLAYVIVKDSILHDGWRHLTFVYPPMVVLAALAWNEGFRLLKSNKIGTYVLAGALALTLLEPAVFMLRNPTTPYVYFNPVSGGLSGNQGYYETDYWGVTVKDALDWMIDEGIIDKANPNKITIASSFSYALGKYVQDDYKNAVGTTYVRYNQRYDRPWDYAIFPSRYVRGPHLRAGTWPGDELVHTIEANGVPLAVIVKSGGPEMFEAVKAIKEKRWADAVRNAQVAAQRAPNNELAQTTLANAYLNSGQVANAQAAAERALAIAPDNIVGLYLKGLAQLNQRQPQEALTTFERANVVNPTYLPAYYYKAVALRDLNRPADAIQAARKALEINPNFTQAKTLLTELGG